MGKSNYTLTVQEVTRQEKGKADLAYGVLSLTSPKGVSENFYFRSGGWGKGALPGLGGEKINGNDINCSAVYDLDLGSSVISADGMKVKGGKDSYEYKPGKGFWIPLRSPNETSRDGFGIHPDGGVDGTLGCIGLAKDDCERFQKLWATLKESHALPESLLVLKPDSKNIDLNLVAEKFGERSSSGFYRYQRSEEVKLMQEKINELREAQGLKKIKEDGMLGPETASAMIISGFDKEMAKTLKLDDAALAELKSAAANGDHKFFKKLNSKENFSELAGNFKDVANAAEAMAAALPIKNIKIESSGNSTALNNKKESLYVS